MKKSVSFGFSFLTAAVLAAAGCLWMAAFPEAALIGAREGISLWVTAVVPSLLPFLIGIRFLSALGLPKEVGRLFEPLFQRFFRVPGEGAFFFLSSVCSGYPIGARLIGDARRQGSISKEEGETLLALCSTSGPLFLLGTIGSSLLQNSALGLTVTLSHYGGALLNGLLWRKKAPGRRKSAAAQQRAPREIVALEQGLLPLLTDCMLQGVRTVVLVGCYVMLFSMITKALPLEGETAIWCKGLLEMTVGCAAAAETFTDPLTAAAFCCFFVSFGGLSIYLQSISFLDGTDLSKGKFLLQKVTQAILSAGLAVLQLRFLP